VIVDCAVYTNGVRRPGDLPITDALEAASEADSFVWVGLHEPSSAEFSVVKDELGLHRLAVEDAIAAHQRPKLEIYGDSVFVVLTTAHYDDLSETVTSLSPFVMVRPVPSPMCEPPWRTTPSASSGGPCPCCTP
jgi:magnesium transporter